MKSTLVVTVGCCDQDGVLLAPTGLDTPYERCLGVDVMGGHHELLAERNTGQSLIVIRPESKNVTLTYRYEPECCHYCDGMFVRHDSRFTRAADALAVEAAGLAPHLQGTERQIEIARATAERFTYGHPPERFYDSHTEIPALGCGLTQGSCVDINAYFIATLRSAGFEVGYITGYFFPEEKRGVCEDMHCWVVTRQDGVFLEWDIAHHLKMGRRDIQPGLNPKPGVRHAVAHSMGLNVPELGLDDLKLVGEPVWVLEEGQVKPTFPDIRRVSV